jgi:hypothetical protein
MALCPYDFVVKHRPGVSNPADGPSRRPDYEAEVSMGGEAARALLPTLQKKLGLLPDHLLTPELRGWLDSDHVARLLREDECKVYEPPRSATARVVRAGSTLTLGRTVGRTLTLGKTVSDVGEAAKALLPTLQEELGLGSQSLSELRGRQGGDCVIGSTLTLGRTASDAGEAAKALPLALQEKLGHGHLSSSELRGRQVSDSDAGRTLTLGKTASDVGEAAKALLPTLQRGVRTRRSPVVAGTAGPARQ